MNSKKPPVGEGKKRRKGPAKPHFLEKKRGLERLGLLGGGKKKGGNLSGAKERGVDPSIKTARGEKREVPLSGTPGKAPVHGLK